MHPVLWLLLVAAVFWGLFIPLYKRYNLKRYGFSFESGALFFRTRKGLDILDTLGKKYRRALLCAGNFASAIAIFLMVFVFINLCYNLYVIFSRPQIAVPGIGLVFPEIIPGLTVYWWLISVGVLMLVHECAHGLQMRAHNIPTKSVGGLLLGILPGAFVEPDEKKLSQAPVSHKLRIYSAGSIANLLLSLVLMLFLCFLVVPKPGVYVGWVRPGGPSENLLEPGMKILKLGETTINDWRDLKNIRFEPGENVEVLTDRGSFTIVADNFYSENEGSIGIGLLWASPRSELLNPRFMLMFLVYELRGARILNPIVYDPLVSWALIDMIKWMFILNLGVGLFNLLPMLPLDGGYMLQAMLEKKLPRKLAKRVCILFSVVVLFIILLNVVPYLR